MFSLSSLLIWENKTRDQDQKNLDDIQIPVEGNKNISVQLYFHENDGVYMGFLRQWAECKILFQNIVFSTTDVNIAFLQLY